MTGFVQYSRRSKEKKIRTRVGGGKNHPQTVWFSTGWLAGSRGEAEMFLWRNLLLVWLMRSSSEPSLQGLAHSGLQSETKGLKQIGIN